MMFSNFWTGTKNKQKSNHKVNTIANAKTRIKNKAITIPKFNFNSIQIKIIVKGEHAEHTIYLLFCKSQGLEVLITKKLTVFILKTYADDVIIKQINYF